MKQTKLPQNDPIGRIKQLSKQRGHPQAITQTFHKIQQEGIKYDDETYIIAQNAWIKLHCQNKTPIKALDLWNDMLQNAQIKEQLGNKEYYATMSTLLDTSYSQQALDVFYQMIKNGIKPDIKSYNLAVRIITKLKSLSKANEIYDMIQQEMPQYLDDSLLQNHFMNMYLKCGDMDKAQQIFKSLSNKQEGTTWNILINGMIDDNKSQDAIHLFHQMKTRNINPDQITYSMMAKAIWCVKSLEEANKLYEMIQNDENVNIYKEIPVCNALITMFGKCGDASMAEEIWNGLKEKCPKQINIKCLPFIKL